MGKVHRVVMAAFVDSSPLQVNHKDLNKLNNALENLEYVTHAENTRHARDNKPNWALKGDAHPNLKVSFDELVEILFMRHYHVPIKNIAIGYGIREDYVKGLRFRVDYQLAYNQVSQLILSPS